ncbi:hypothetical protein [Halococcus thailandensis]|uniref:hypothetical protein n=1 Tax=Halococcus thailandensis TaxID=335952 RepID=UPI001268302B|nr:hypothetical protein [Halococcus thailandensis]
MNGEEIPTTEVESRFEPAKSILVNRISEVKHPLEWQGEDIQGKVNAYQGDQQGQWDTASVFWQNVRNSEYVSRHYGFIRGAGPAGDEQGVGKLMIEDPVTLFSTVPFSKRYDEPSTGTVLNDVVDEFNANTPFDLSLGSVDIEKIEGADLWGDIVAGAVEDVGDDVVGGLLGETNTDGQIFGNTRSAIGREMKTSKSFKSNEHTIKSAMDWLSRISRGNYRLSGAKPLKLIFDTDDSQTTHYTSTAINGKNKVADRNMKFGGSYRANDSPAIDVINSNVLSETGVINTITVNGKSGSSLYGMDVSPLNSEKYPSVTVEEPALVKRAGGQAVKGPIQTTDDKTLEAAEGSAKKKLQEKIVNSGEGTIESFCAPLLIPGDFITTIPECSDMVPNANLTPITVQVNHVRHHKKHDDEARTYAGVSPVAKKNEMRIVESEMKKI